MILCIWYPAQRSWGDMLVFFSVFSSFVYMFPFSSFIHNELYDMSKSWPGQVQKPCINPNYVFNWTRTILYHSRNMDQWSTTYFISDNFLIMKQIEIPSLAGLYQSPYDTKMIDINIQLYKKSDYNDNNDDNNNDKSNNNNNHQQFGSQHRKLTKSASLCERNPLVNREFPSQMCCMSGRHYE